MQRYYHTVRDSYGNPASGVSVTVYLAGTSTLASIFDPTGSDTASTVLANPIITDATGIVGFAAADGDYDLYFYGTNITPYWQRRVNLFDSTTATTIPVSSISLTVPSEFTTTGSPGTSIAIVKATETANTVWAGPTTGAAAAPTFRALVTADVTPVAVDLSTAQASIGGAKTWTAAATFSAGLTTTTATASGKVTANAGIDLAGNLVLGPTSKVNLNTATPYSPYVVVPAIPVGSATATAAAFAGTIKCLSFANAATNEAHFYVVLGSDVPAGATLYPFINWGGSGTSTGVVRWGMEIAGAYTNAAAGVSGTTTTYAETAGTGSAAGSTTSVFAGHSTSASGPMTIIMIRVFRDGSHVNDTNVDSAFLFGLGLMYAVDYPFGVKNTTYPFN